MDQVPNSLPFCDLWEFMFDFAMRHDAMSLFILGILENDDIYKSISFQQLKKILPWCHDWHLQTLFKDYIANHLWEICTEILEVWSTSFEHPFVSNDMIESYFRSEGERDPKVTYFLWINNLVSLDICLLKSSQEELEKLQKDFSLSHSLLCEQVSIALISILRPTDLLQQICLYGFSPVISF